MKTFWQGKRVPVTGAGENMISDPFDGYGMNPGRPDDSERAAGDLRRMRTQVLSQEDV